MRAVREPTRPHPTITTFTGRPSCHRDGPVSAGLTVAKIEQDHFHVLLLFLGPEIRAVVAIVGRVSALALLLHLSEQRKPLIGGAPKRLLLLLEATDLVVGGRRLLSRQAGLQAFPDGV